MLETNRCHNTSLQQRSHFINSEIKNYFSTQAPQRHARTHSAFLLSGDFSTMTIGSSRIYYSTGGHEVDQGKYGVKQAEKT